MRVAVAGLGYWGPNIARNLARSRTSSWPGAVTPPRPAARACRAFPGARFTGDLEDVLADESVDAVALATPVPLHARLAIASSRPASTASSRSRWPSRWPTPRRSSRRRRAAGRVLMVGHLLEYHPGVIKLKQLIDDGELGRVLYIYGNRLNLGKLRADENALWSLGAHDVSVLLRLAGEEPFEVEARGESYMREGVEDVVFCFLRFPSGLSAHLHLSWLDPHKERRFTVVGDARMATFDDMALEGKITVYDKGFDEQANSYGEYITRSGDIWSPRLLERRAAADRGRALRRARCARARRRPPTARPGCASCGCWRRCSARSTPRAARGSRAPSRSRRSDATAPVGRRRHPQQPGRGHRRAAGAVRAARRRRRARRGRQRVGRRHARRRARDRARRHRRGDGPQRRLRGGRQRRRASRERRAARVPEPGRHAGAGLRGGDPGAPRDGTRGWGS